MKQYYKDGQIVERPKSLTYNGSTYVPPTDEILMAAGYNVVEVEPEPITNVEIAEQRAREYAVRADKVFLAYQAYLTLGETEKAEELKEQWLEIREEINKELPYLPEEENTNEEA